MANFSGYSINENWSQLEREPFPSPKGVAGTINIIILSYLFVHNFRNMQDTKKIVDILIVVNSILY